ncbi:MAG: family 78 glycoside hydrolase catalytic domain [Candidatus Omnitrophota bacterium]
MKTVFFSETCRWIWLSGNENQVNQYIQFRKCFNLQQKPVEATIKISVDSDYQLFVNEVEVFGRQFSDYPHYRSFNTHQVSSCLQKGKNVISVLAYHRGEDSFEYRKGRPGLIFQMSTGKDVLMVSDASWDCRLSPTFTSGPVPKVTRQLGFTVNYDAGKEDEWQKTGYSLAGWDKVREISGPTDGYWKNLRPRPLPALVQGEFLPGRLVAKGTIIRGEISTPARTMDGSFKRAERLSQSKTIQPFSDKNKGVFLVFDLGREETGLLQFSLQAPGGTLVDIGHGEHLDDLGVRTFVGGREFADRYICREGINNFTLPFRRLGCRYLEFHISGFNEPITFCSAGIVPLSYPTEERGSFSSSDSLVNQTRKTAVRTLKLCMHEHYEDCPWREQSLYAFDSRNQALYGYYAFGEYDFPEISFSLLGWGLHEDGLLEMCAPGRIPFTIPSFSLVWISALRDHFLFSGRARLFRKFRPTIDKILASFLVRRDEQTGLYKLFEGNQYWSFYEWAPGLEQKNETERGTTGDFRLDAPHNLFLLEAIEAYRDMLVFSGEEEAAAGWQQKSAVLKKAIHNNFWDRKRKLYATFSDRSRKWHYSELVQTLAVTYGLGPTGVRSHLRKIIFNSPHLVPMSLSTMLYAGQALFGSGLKEQIKLLETCSRTFSSMLYKDATSLWETTRGADDFEYAGSLCHGWSALPIWLNQAYILGVIPKSPGFRSFVVSPHPANLSYATGKIPTPAGVIAVEWEQSQNVFSLNVSAPKSCNPAFRPNIAKEVRCKIFLNGQKIS